MIYFREHPILRNCVVTCLGVLSGVLFIKLSGHGEKSHLILCSEYFLYQYAYESIEYKELGFYVLVNRIPLFLLLVLGAFSKYRQKIAGGVVYVVTFGVTYLLGAGIMRYGVRALALIFGLMTPQILFYCQSMLLLLEQKKKNPMKCLGWAGGLFLTGILCEVYVNPRWLRFLLSLF